MKRKKERKNEKKERKGKSGNTHVQMSGNLRKMLKPDYTDLFNKPQTQDMALSLDDIIEEVFQAYLLQKKLLQVKYF